MSISQLSQLAAVGTFDGAIPEQLTPSRGFGAITRTEDVLAGSWDIEIDLNISGPITLTECQILVTPEGKGQQQNTMQYKIVSATLLRVQNYNLDDLDFSDTKFSVVVHRIN